jgi:hypothetical protein
MNARDRRRLTEAAGVLMTTRGMDPVQATIEAATQLGMIRGVVIRRSEGPGDLGAALERLITLLDQESARRAEIDATTGGPQRSR